MSPSESVVIAGAESISETISYQSQEGGISRFLKE